MIVTIDGKAIECQAGEYLLDVAGRGGIEIPSICHHEGLPGLGCCRVCLVEVETGGRREIVTACVYPVERECTVFTDSDAVLQNRRVVLALLRARVPESELIARYCEKYGVPENGRLSARDDTGTCVLCGLCVEACAKLGTGAISTVNRGVDKKVSTPYDEPSMACVGCASCASVCPTGAIAVSEDESARVIWNKEFPLARCKRCGVVIGTAFEIRRAARRVDAQPPELCERCRRLAMTDVMAETYENRR